MIGYSLLTGPGPYRFELVPTEPNAKGDALAVLRGVLPKTPFERPAHAIKAANLMLWPKLFGHSFAFLQIDDEDIADLVVDHLSDDNSWLRTRLLEHPTLAFDIVGGLDRLAVRPLEWLAHARYRFLLVLRKWQTPSAASDRWRPHRSVDRYEGGPLYGQRHHRAAGKSQPDTQSPADVSGFVDPAWRARAGRQLSADLLSPDALCRLPGAGAAGVDEDLRQALATDDVPGAWGHRVIECDGDPLELFLDGRNGGIDRLSASSTALAIFPSPRHVEA